MRFKLDENVTDDLVAEMAAIGHDTATCEQEGIAGTGDPAILAHACAESRILVTCDHRPVGRNAEVGGGTNSIFLALFGSGCDDIAIRACSCC